MSFLPSSSAPHDNATATPAVPVFVQQSPTNHSASASQQHFPQVQMSISNVNHQQPTVQNMQSPPMTSFDLGDVSFPDLLNGINPDLIDYFQNNTPQVFSALMKQDNKPLSAPATTSHPVPMQTVPMQTVPMQTVPMQTVPMQSLPMQSLPMQSLPMQSPPMQSVPMQSVAMQSVHMPNESNITSFIEEVVSATNSASSRSSVAAPQILPIVNHSHLNPQQQSSRPHNPNLNTPANNAAAAAAGAAAAAAAAAAVNPQYAVPQNVPMRVVSPVRNNQPKLAAHPPHINPNEAHLTAAHQRAQLSAARARMTSEQHAAFNAAARSQMNSAQNQLNNVHTRFNAAATAQVQTARARMPSQSHIPTAHAQLSAAQTRMTGVQNPASAMSTAVPAQSMPAASAKAKVPDKRAKNRAKDLPQRAVVKKEMSTNSPSSLVKRPAPPNRVQTGVNPAAIPSHVMAAPQLQMSVKMEDPDMEGTDGGEEDVEVKKAMRAERNRQSAAASRERKKHHIKELERRVTTLSQENAQLQVGQLQIIRDRIAKERSLLQENKELKRKVVFRDMKIERLSRDLQSALVKNGPEDPTLRRPNTWDASEWGKRNKIKIV